MHIVRASQSTKASPIESTTIFEYHTSSNDISGAVATMHGRYPEQGFAKNEICKELVYISEGNGVIILPTEKQQFTKGDVILIDKDEKFYWQGNFSMFMVTTPSFSPKQHKIII